jgi:hypothetical protein
MDKYAAEKKTNYICPIYLEAQQPECVYDHSPPLGVEVNDPERHLNLHNTRSW